MSPGGAIPGSGRKPRGDAAASNVTIRLNADELARIDAYAAEHGLTRSEAMRTLVEKGRRAGTPLP